MADIIDLTKLREAQAAADATARLHEILCVAAEATATGLCAACSNQTATAPTPSTVAKPPATVPATPGAATPPGPSTTTASGSTLTPATSGVMVLDQFDPPVPIEVNR